MDRREAYTIASSWGSYINGSDPGRCFYAFYAGDARPMSEEHREQCIAYAKQLVSNLTVSLAWLDDDDNAMSDVADLNELIDFFETTELHPTAERMAA
jgi:hypothetical protein